MDLRDLIDAMVQDSHIQRQQYHLTLGMLKDALSEAPKEAAVVFEDKTAAGEFDSYRGHYIDISISDGEVPETVEVWREKVSIALKTTFVGYKGGDYPASPEKPLWRSEYGEASNQAIVGFDFTSGSEFKLLTKQIED